MPNKRTTHKRQTSGRHTGPVPHRRPNVFVRLLQRMPGWAWWIGGLSVVAVYVYFFYYIFVGPFGFRWRALYGDVSYPEGYEIHGIDISHYQGHINWKTLQDKGLINETPIRFIMIKATEGATRIDPLFKENFLQAREHGFTRGAYHFYSVSSPADKQAYFFIRNVHLENGDLIYTYYKFKMRYLSDPVFDSYPYWIAHYYVDEVEYKGAWKFWQHTDAGRLPGITGQVDFDIYNGSFYDLRKMTIGAREQIGEDAYAD